MWLPLISHWGFVFNETAPVNAFENHFFLFMVYSAHNEERNLLRIRAWEQRNQETSQAKELNHQNVPLFGEPYKVKNGSDWQISVQTALF